MSGGRLPQATSNADDVPPAAILRSAEAFHAAASKLHPEFPEPQKTDLLELMPAYFLYGQAMELALKAYLRAKGASAESLWRTYGHDLQKLYLACDWGLRMALGRDCGGMVGCLCHQYADMKWYNEFRYIRHLGPRELPTLGAVNVFAGALLDAVRRACSGEAIEQPVLDCTSNDEIGEFL